LPEERAVWLAMEGNMRTLASGPGSGKE